MRDTTAVDWSEVTVVIPVKACSSRVRDKNFRDFCDGRSLLEIKIRQLLNIVPRSQIVVVVAGARPQGNDLPALHGIECMLEDGDDRDFYEHMRAICERVKTRYVVRACVVTPFATETDLAAMAGGFLAQEQDFDCAATVQVLRSHVVDRRGAPVNFESGALHAKSQELPRYYMPRPAGFMMRTSDARRLAGPPPRVLFHVLDVIGGLDINEPEDWWMARCLAQSPEFRKGRPWLP